MARNRAGLGHAHELGQSVSRLALGFRGPAGHRHALGRVSGPGSESHPVSQAVSLGKPCGQKGQSQAKSGLAGWGLASDFEISILTCFLPMHTNCGMNQI